VALETWCAWLGELTGIPPQWHETPDTIASLPVDLTRMHALDTFDCAHSQPARRLYGDQE
jgi:hypothetical protein